ncbi:MAG: hypothetical protein ACI9YO_000387 [Gammaproteobacteria bacterium]|jgi:hypothetical protein
MKINGLELSTKLPVLIRRMAVRLVFNRESPANVILSYRLSDRAIYLWIRLVEKMG